MSTTWKQTERAVAAKLGGKRTGPTGRNTADVDHPTLAPEVKHRQTLPAWLTAAMAQAQRNAPPGRVAIVVLHQHGQRHDDDLVVLRLADFTTLTDACTAPLAYA